MAAVTPFPLHTSVQKTELDSNLDTNDDDNWQLGNFLKRNIYRSMCLILAGIQNLVCGKSTFASRCESLCTVCRTHAPEEMRVMSTRQPVLPPPRSFLEAWMRERQNLIFQFKFTQPGVLLSVKPPSQGGKVCLHVGSSTSNIRMTAQGKQIATFVWDIRSPYYTEWRVTSVLTGKPWMR